MKTDIQIAQEAVMKPIAEVAEKLGIQADELELYGKYKAKISDEYMKRIAGNPDGELILGIREYGNICIRVDGGVGACTRTDLPADLELSVLEASRFLFGVLPPHITVAVPKEKAVFVAANFPLPLYTHHLDKS